MKKRNEIRTRLGAMLLVSSLLPTVAGATGGIESTVAPDQMEMTATQGQEGDQLDTLEILPESQTMTLTALVVKNDSTYKIEIPEGDGDKVEIFDIDGDQPDEDDIQDDQPDENDAHEDDTQDDTADPDSVD